MKTAPTTQRPMATTFRPHRTPPFRVGNRVICETEVIGCDDDDNELALPAGAIGVVVLTEDARGGVVHVVYPPGVTQVYQGAEWLLLRRA
jgi:hypothetical protein